MKKLLMIFSIILFITGCMNGKSKNTKTVTEDITDAGYSSIIRKIEKREKKSEYTDEYYASSEYVKCTYSWDKRNKRVIVLGNENFNEDSDIVKQSGKNIKCVYFSMYDTPFEPAEYTTPYELWDGTLEGHYIYDNNEDYLFIEEIYLKINSDNTIEVAGVAERTEGKDILSSRDEKFKFCYKGKVKEGFYTDLWK